MEVEKKQLTKEVEDAEVEKLFFQDDAASSSDWRKCPEWDVAYRQQVTPSDVFLGVDNSSILLIYV